jgi:hypothetical protein
MARRIATVAALVILPLLAGCPGPYVPARITSVTDPAFHSRLFTHIAVVVDTADLGWRLKLERWLAETLRSKGMNAVEGSSVMPPTRGWNAALAQSMFAARSIDAYLTLEIIARGEWTRAVPLTTSTEVTTERNRKESGEEDAKEEVTVTTTTTQEGGYTQQIHWTRYAIRLVDVATGDVAWMATSDINGDPDRRIWSFCQEIVAQLHRDGLIRADSLVVKTGG